MTFSLFILIFRQNVKIRKKLQRATENLLIYIMRFYAITTF